MKIPKTVKSGELSFLRMVSGNEKIYDRVIDAGVVKQWVGFGWIEDGAPGPIDLATLPTVEHAS